MHPIKLVTFFGYLLVLVFIVYITLKKQKTEKDFVLGSRGLNFWLTALSAHASDMSQWLFMGFPALVYMQGIFGAWTAIGLTVFMFINWHFIAPKIRIITEQTNSLTLNAYFENRFADKSGVIRLISALITLTFFTIYISSGVVALGSIVETLFGLDPMWGMSIGVILIASYVYVGGYTTVAWIDLFQGFFLLAVIIGIPAFLFYNLGGFSPVMEKVRSLGLSTSLLPDYSLSTFLSALAFVFGWGLGYLGQPHILTKFMGIKKVTDMKKSKYLGISWQILALGAATSIGLFGIYLFPESTTEPSKIILLIANQFLSPFFIGLILCAILAAVTNVMAAQILIVASSLSEDVYKRWFNREASSRQLLNVSRMSVLFTAIVAYIIASLKISTIYSLVLFAWSGIGGAFGPLVLSSLYSKKINRYGAIAGLLIGGITALFWPFVSHHFPIIKEFPIIPAFILSFISIFAISRVTKEKGLEYES